MLPWEPAAKFPSHIGTVQPGLIAASRRQGGRLASLSDVNTAFPLPVSAWRAITIFGGFLDCPVSVSAGKSLNTKQAAENDVAASHFTQRQPVAALFLKKGTPQHPLRPD